MHALIIFSKGPFLERDTSRELNGITQVCTRLLLCELQSLLLHRLSLTNLSISNGKVSDIGIESMICCTNLPQRGRRERTNHLGYLTFYLPAYFLTRKQPRFTRFECIPKTRHHCFLTLAKQAQIVTTLKCLCANRVKRFRR